jgi:hypothetical protein
MTTNNAVNAPFPLSATQGGLGVASPTAHGILIAEGASAATPIVLTAGQVLIGTTSSDPTGALLTPGTNIGITSATGSITINSTGVSSFAWNDVASGTQALAVNQGYITDNGASLVTYTLPVTAAEGTEIAVAGFSSGLWTIHQNASQLIHFGNQVTTTGTGGSLAASNAFDCVRLLCVVANTTWVVLNAVGNLTYV